MAYEASLLPQLSQRQRRLDDLHPYCQDAQRQFVYDFDAVFVDKYDALLDRISRTLQRHGNTDEVIIEDYFNIYFIMDILVGKIRETVDREETICEYVMDDFTQNIADDLIEDLCDFFNSDIEPRGLREVLGTIPDSFMLIEVWFSEEDNVTYYAFDEG